MNSTIPDQIWGTFSAIYLVNRNINKPETRDWVNLVKLNFTAFHLVSLEHLPRMTEALGSILSRKKEKDRSY